MALYEVPNLTSGLDQALVGTVTAVPEFMTMFLVFIFGVVFLGGSINQKRRTGSADMPMWATIASMATLLTALPLTLTAGLIQLEVLSIIVVITIFSGLWLFLDKGRNEF